MMANQTAKQTAQRIGIISLVLLLVSFLVPVYALDVSTFSVQQFQEDPEITEDITQLNQEIDQHKTKITEIEQKKRDLQDQLNIIQRETYSIQRQINQIENQVLDTEYDIEKKTIEIEQRKLEIERLAELIQIKEVEIGKSKERLSTLIRIIDEQDRQSPLYVLLSRDSFSSYLEDIQSAAGLQVQVQQEVSGLKNAKGELDTQKQEQEQKTAELKETKESLERNRETLNQQRTYQEQLHQQSKNREVPFEELLAQIHREEDNANAQVRALEDAVRARLFELNKGLISNENVPLAWPLILPGLNAASCSVKITCSAVFSDSSYRSYFGRDHRAVDVPIAQGSPVYAPADGYVTGLIPGYVGSGGLSILTIQHTDSEGLVTDMKTRYLHMSSFVVSYNPDAPVFVRKGEVVGYSGGKCGTSGAGTCGVHTTGPHLHFEVWFGAAVVNPLNYLP